MQVTKAVTILRPPSEVYQYWRRFENLPCFMYHLLMVEDLGDGRSHWVAKAPAGRSVEWDAELTEDTPDQLIAWRSIGSDDDVKNWGSVHFTPAPKGRGTEVRVDLFYDPPAGKAGSGIAKVFGEEPNQQLTDDLRRFKQIMEIGEVVRSSASPEGLGQGIRGQGPARPGQESEATADVRR